MVLSLDVQQKVIDRVVELAGGELKPCPLCENSFFLAQWVFLVDSASTVIHGGDSPFWNEGTSKGVSPQFAFICKVCGYTMFFNAAVLGLLHLITSGPYPDEGLAGLFK
jgi:hypothetical protein